MTRQWDTLISLVSAAILSVLSALDVMAGEAVAASTLAVLALLGVALVKDREARDRMEASLIGVDEQLRVSHEVILLPAALVNDEFEQAMKRTVSWRFKGGTGTYLRAETLPSLAVAATTRRDVWIEILDPSDADLCEEYADYRQKLASPRSASDQSLWSSRQVQIESLATVIAAVWFSQNKHLQIRVALSTHMSTFRYDMSDHALFITNEDAEWSAIKADRRGSIYHRFRDELTYSFDQARPVDLRQARSLPGRHWEPRVIGGALEELGLAGLDRLTADRDACSLIAHLAVSARHARRLGFPRGGAENPYELTGRPRSAR